MSVHFPRPTFPCLSPENFFEQNMFTPNHSMTGSATTKTTATHAHLAGRGITRREGQRRYSRLGDGVLIVT